MICGGNSTLLTSYHVAMKPSWLAWESASANPLGVSRDPGFPFHSIRANDARDGAPGGSNCAGGPLNKSGLSEDPDICGLIDEERFLVGEGFGEILAKLLKAEQVPRFYC